MRLHFLLGVGIRRREGAIQSRLLALVQHHRENAERELVVARRKLLGLRGEDAELQLSASLHRLEIQRASAWSVTLSLPTGIFYAQGVKTNSSTSPRGMSSSRDEAPSSRVSVATHVVAVGA